MVLTNICASGDEETKHELGLANAGKCDPYWGYCGVTGSTEEFFIPLHMRSCQEAEPESSGVLVTKLSAAPDSFL